MTESAGTVEHATLTHLLKTLMPQWRAVDISHFEYLSGGYSNENYRFSHDSKDYVLRVPSRKRPYVDRFLELSFYRNQHAVPIPHLVAFDAPSGLMLTLFEQGPLLADARPPVPDLVAYLKKTHAALPPSGRMYDPLEMSRNFLSVGRAPDWIKRLSSRDWTPLRIGSCHNDLNPWNVIISTPNRWVTLDWEWFGDNDPLFDLISLHQGLDLSGSSLTGAIELLTERPLDHGYAEACLTAYWLREYAWAHAERHHGTTRPEIEDQLRHSAEKLQALRD